MNIPIEMPSGKIINLARFIALLPDSNTTDTSYQLILEGYPSPINLELPDAQSLKKILESSQVKLGSDGQTIPNKDKQLEKNQRAIELLVKQIEQYRDIPESESIARRENYLKASNKP